MIKARDTHPRRAARGGSLPDRGTPPGALTPGNHRGIGLLLLLGLISLAIRAVMVSKIPILTGKDTFVYMALADNLAAGRGFVRDYIVFFWHPDASAHHGAEDWVGPLVPLMMAPFVKLMGRVTLAYALPVLLMHSLGLPLAVRGVALRLGATARVAWLAGLTALLQPDMLREGTLPLTDIPFVVFMTVALVCLLDKRGGLWSAVGAGVALGLASLTRASANAFLPILLLAYPLRSGRLGSLLSPPALLVVAFDLVVQAPWLVRNLTTFGDPLHSAYQPTAAILGHGAASFRERFEELWWHRATPSLLDRYDGMTTWQWLTQSARWTATSLVRIGVPGWMGPWRWPAAVLSLAALPAMWRERHDWRTQHAVLLLAAFVAFHVLLWFPAERRYFYPTRPVVLAYWWMAVDGWLAKVASRRRWWHVLGVSLVLAVELSSAVRSVDGLKREVDATRSSLAVAEIALLRHLGQQTPAGTTFLTTAATARSTYFSGRPAVRFLERVSREELQTIIEHYRCSYAYVLLANGRHLAQAQALTALGWVETSRLGPAVIMRTPDAPPLPELAPTARPRP